MTDRRLVLLVNALLEGVGAPANLNKKFCFLLSDNGQEIDWPIVEYVSYHLEKLIALHKFEQQYKNSKVGTEKRLVDLAQKNWFNEWKRMDW